MHKPGAPLRLMIYDRTCTGAGPLPGLSHVWSAGGGLYRALGALDDACGVASWSEGLAWLSQRAEDRAVGEIQFWGHGRWGCALIGGERLDASSFSPGHALHPALEALKPHIVSGGHGLFWFRTCETFGTRAGHDFARTLSRFFDCRAAGHTFVIGAIQSGLHVLAPGEEPSWSVDEGVIAGAASARRSRLSAPNTVTFLRRRLKGP